MSTPPSKPPSPPGSKSPSDFSLDRDTTGMSVPSVTQLLNRKSFTQEIEKNRLKGAPPPQQQPPPPHQQTRSITQVASTADPAGQVFQTSSQPDRVKGLATLLAWSDVDPSKLPGIAALLPISTEGQKLNLWSRMLVLAKHSTGNEHTYIAEKAWGPSDAALLWDGVTLKPASHPLLWSHLQRSGYQDLPVIASEVLAEPEQRILREALGIHKTEAALIIRLGPAGAPWGIALWVAHPGMEKKIPQGAALSQWAQKWIQELAQATKPS